MSNSNYVNNITDILKQARDLSLQHWLRDELFSWQWWFGIAMIIIPLAYWWFKVDKKRLIEISLFGLSVFTFAAVMDVSGSELLLWVYPIRILPQTPLLFPVDIVDLPVIMMLIYQRFGKWGMLLLINTIISAVMSFLFEPIAVYIGVYTLISWRYIYSFPIYILMALTAKLLVGFFKKIQRVSSEDML